MTLWAYSIFGHQTRKGLVKICRDKEVIAQMTPAEARDWAANVLQAAEAAETDEFLMEHFTNRLGSESLGGRVLQDFREFRDRKQEEK